MMIHEGKAAVFDNVFESDQFQTLRRFLEEMQYANLLQSPEWVKVWRMNDGIPLRGTQHHSDNKPFNNPMDWVAHYAEEFAKMVPQFMGDWDSYVITPYLYPRNTRISWHNDGSYTAALIFYLHKHWSATWGGELMVADVPSDIEKYGDQGSGPHLDHEWEDRYLGAYGSGLYIAPKPNRAVITPGGAWHSINRVDADAGQNVRTSIVVFFEKKDGKEKSMGQ